MAQGWDVSLNCFLFSIQIENSAEEFALYVVHTSGGESEEHSTLQILQLTQNSKLKTKASVPWLMFPKILNAVCLQAWWACGTSAPENAVWAVILNPQT